MDKLLIALILLVVTSVLGLLLAFPVMWCWNFAVVSTFGLPVITWGKAWCLVFLSNMLIKSTLIENKS